MDQQRPERITITVPVRSAEAAIECLKVRSVALHERASRTRDGTAARDLRKSADALDAAAEDFRRAVHGFGGS